MGWWSQAGKEGEDVAGKGEIPAENVKKTGQAGAMPLS
jgi:hypothetical protein